MIDHFSDYLKENRQQIDDSRLVPFDREMESVDNYLYLEMQRFPGRIEVIRDIRVSDFSVPPLSIQTIVENAIRHGISMKGGKGTLKITTETDGTFIVITVEDDGKGFDVENTDFDGLHHIGIKNVRDRFKNLLNGDVTVESRIGTGTRVVFKIPIGQEWENK